MIDKIMQVMKQIKYTTVLKSAFETRRIQGSKEVDVENFLN